MLDVSDAVIANCIIDHRRVEYVLLCENAVEAASVMLDNPPPKYVEMFAMNGDQFCSKPCFRLLLKFSNKLTFYELYFRAAIGYNFFISLLIT